MSRLSVVVPILVMSMSSVAREPAASENQDQEVRSLTERYFAALDEGDVHAFDQMTMGQFIAIHLNGRARAKPVVMDSLRAHPSSPRRTEIERSWQDLTVRSFGDTTILSGLLRVKDDGHPEPVVGTRTLTWVHRGAVWGLAHDQWTPAPESGTAEYWNEVYLGYIPGASFNTSPNALLVETVEKLPPGSALDVGMGEGRNAVYLATRGWNVTGFDPAEAGLAIARRQAIKAGVHITPILLGIEEFEWGTDRWDVIVLLYVPFRGYINEIRQALKPGGIAVVEAFHREASRDREIGG